MYEFMEANGLPCGHWAGIWRSDKGYPDPDQAIAQATTAVARNKTTAAGLLVVKMCHISMGHYDSSFAVKNLDALKQQSTLDRIRSLYTIVPTDRTRSWGPIFDPMTQSIPAGLMVQVGPVSLLSLLLPFRARRVSIAEVVVGSEAHVIVVSVWLDSRTSTASCRPPPIASTHSRETLSQPSSKSR